jgi:molybdopterin-guanine dinucleotide biosynthesis protein A
MDSTCKHIDNVTGVLLAGGKSRRMGTDKRFLKLGGETLLQRALSVYERMFSEIIVVVAQSTPELGDIGHPIVRDLIPNCATLGGLYTGLSVARYPRIFAAACDMPFLNPTVIGHLLEWHDDDVVMPKLASGLQPMHAVYSKACLPYFQQMMLMNNLSIQAVLESRELRIQLVPEEVLTTFDARLLSFLNLNTPEDVELARILVEHGVVQGEDSR